MLVVINFFVVVSILSSPFVVYCLKSIFDRGAQEKPYGLIKEEEDFQTVREASSEPLLLSSSRQTGDLIQETQLSPDSPEMKTAAGGLVLVPVKTQEQKNFDERYRLLLEAKMKRRRADYSEEMVSYDEEEDTLFGVKSLLTDVNTSKVHPRSVK